ncbi:MAG: hypothetical protein IH950_09475 [Bacteroidetes bacterium]|nr:hypothetical protein [Bacteroidota bacterium]MCH8033967.1 hypothetical protein [Bacteroidota bacterium]
MKKLFLNISLLLIIWIFCGCSSISQIDLTGKWGGEHIGIVVSDSSATLVYDCAHGTIDEPIIPDDDGKFEVRGVHVFEHGGAIRIDETPDEHPALYKGHIVGNEMTLILVITDTDTEIDTFSLTRGVDPLIHKCL